MAIPGHSQAGHKLDLVFGLGMDMYLVANLRCHGLIATLWRFSWVFASHPPPRSRQWADLCWWLAHGDWWIHLDYKILWFIICADRGLPSLWSHWWNCPLHPQYKTSPGILWNSDGWNGNSHQLEQIWIQWTQPITAWPQTSFLRKVIERAASKQLQNS